MQIFFMDGHCLKMILNSFKWQKKLIFNEEYVKSYDEDSDKGYILEIDVEYFKRLHNLHNNLLFLPEKMKIRKCNRLVCNLYGKINYVAHIRILKQALAHGLILKKCIK